MLKSWGIVLAYLLIQLSSLYFSQRVLATIVFSISNPVVNSNDEIEVDATISGLISSSCSTSGCYLQAELQSAGGYFGYTYNNSGEYVDYFKNAATVDEVKSKLFNIVPVAGGWTGKLRAKNNSLHQNYYGPGDYLLSFRRFSGNSLTPTSTDSNTVPVSLTLVLVTSTPTPTPEVTPTPTPTSFTLKTAPPTPSPTLYPSVKPSPGKTQMALGKPLVTGATESASTLDVLGTESANVRTADPTPEAITDGSKKFPFLSIILISAGICFIGASLFSILKGSKKDYTGESEKESSDIS